MSLVALALVAVTTPVGVGMDEYHVALHRSRVRPGVVKLNVANHGQDPHDLALRTAKGTVLATLTPRVEPGGRAVLRVALRTPGAYRVYCTIAGHEPLGMVATLRVVKPRRPPRSR